MFSPLITWNYLRMPLGPMDMVAILMGSGFRLPGSLDTSLTLPWVLASIARNCLQFTLPAASGALPGLRNIFLCGATTYQLIPQDHGPRSGTYRSHLRTQLFLYC